MEFILAIISRLCDFSKCLLLASCFMLISLSLTNAGDFEILGKYIGTSDAILLADPDGNILYAKNAYKQLIPASTIKIFTALAAFHILGEDYRFRTEFYLDAHRNLTIKGYGDPYLVSEVIDEIGRRLAPMLEPMINNVVVDDSHFSQSLAIPGISSTLRPHDAPNGALCVNFNTVSFKPGRDPGSFISGEAQTPLLPFVLKKIKQSDSRSNRIVLSQTQNDIALYAGHLFGYFMEKNGVRVHGQVRTGRAGGKKEQLIWVHHSSFTVEEIIQKLLEHSNNFMANQLLIAMGIEKYGSPGNLKKGVRAALLYAQELLSSHQLTLAEGSGISRANQVCATTMLQILEQFRPYYHLMKKEKNAFYKTGTLHNVSNLAGYIESEKGLYPFVIFFNSKGKQAFPIMEVLLRKMKLQAVPARK